MTSVHDTDSTGRDGSAGWFVGLWKWSGEENELLKIQGGSAHAGGTGAIASPPPAGSVTTVSQGTSWSPSFLIRKMVLIITIL